MQADVRVENHGSIVLLRPLNEVSENWLDAHVDEEAQYFGNALVVEPRCVGSIIEGLIADGFLVQ